MDKLTFFRPDLFLVGILILLLGAVIGFARRTYIRGRIKREVSLCMEHHSNFRGDCSFSVPIRTVARHFGLVKKLSLRYGINLPVLMRLDEHWVAKMKRRASRRLMDRLLTYSPERGIFPCFNAALKSDRLLKFFLEWIDKSGELMAMDTIAISCDERDFDGKKALDAFGIV